MDSIIRNHPFVDGYKRTGVAAAVLFLQINGYRFDATDAEIESFTLEAAMFQHSLEEITTWLLAHTQPSP